MKRAIIIHNKGAGFGNSSPEELEEFLKNEGYTVISCSLKDERFPEILFEQDAELVVVAGGDGTVKTVALEMAGKEVPLYMYPMGTSNNIATTYGVQKKPLVLSDKLTRKLNIGQFRNGKKTTQFIESAGIGIFSRMMEHMIRKVNYNSKQEKIDKSLEKLLDIIQEPKEYEVKLFLDGEHYDDKYLAIEIMNIPYVGPRLFLAPEADPEDGFFDVVLIGHNQRSELEGYVHARLSGIQHPPQFPVYRAKEVKLVGQGLHLHVDDEIFFADNHNEFVFSAGKEAVLVMAENKQE